MRRLMRNGSNAPHQCIVKPTAKLEVIGGVDNAVAIEIEKWFIVDRTIKCAAKRQIVARIDHSGEIEIGRAAGRCGGSVGIAEETVKRSDPVGGH